MKALVNLGNGKIEVQDVPKPQIQNSTDVLVRITNTTICGSDVHIVRGHLPTQPPHLLGHEFVGVVDEVGSAVTRFKPGDRISGPSSPYCRVCENCRRGKIQICKNTGIFGAGPTMGNLGGAHAEYLVVPFADSNLVKIPDCVSDEQALFVGDILTTGYYGIKNAGLGIGENVVVAGAGPVGLCSIHTAPLFGPANIIAIDILPNRLEMAKKMGATHVINGKEENVVERVRELTSGRGPDLVVDAAGVYAALMQAFEYVADRGRISILAGVVTPMEIPMGNVFFKCLTIYGGLGDLTHMQTMMDLIEANKLDCTPLITHRTNLTDVVDAFNLFAEQRDGVLKVLVKV